MELGVSSVHQAHHGLISAICTAAGIRSGRCTPHLPSGLLPTHSVSIGPTREAQLSVLPLYLLSPWSGQPRAATRWTPPHAERGLPLKRKPLDGLSLCRTTIVQKQLAGIREPQQSASQICNVASTPSFVFPVTARSCVLRRRCLSGVRFAHRLAAESWHSESALLPPTRPLNSQTFAFAF